MKRISKTTHWIKDYLYALGRHFLFYKPIEKYVWPVKKEKSPIILIPGLFEKHDFLEAFADSLSLAGHPIYFSKNLGRNVKDISKSAELVRDLIKEKDLRSVIIVAHSKGGLIGKYLLGFENSDDRIKKLITIATPWKGSSLFILNLHKSFKELRPMSDILNKLYEQKQVNHKIVSIYGESDNVIWPVESCHLEGAKNIQVENHGHHKILFDKKVVDIVMSEVEK
ncbi:MAG: hypothetical protein NTY04_03085 [Candidatus Staskawiczbacteria bacterium]|nr:hypothetical protein [Candidatus Staskawiczbacteria bacterium]